VNLSREDCARAAEFLPRYLDGELAEEHSSGLRGHLLACRTCRAALQAERDARRWFEAPAVAVPGGFAARVAALAALGLDSETRPREPRLPVASASLAADSVGVDSESGALLAFTVRLVGLAALTLLGLSLVLALSARPAQPSALLADPLPEVLERLDQLNRRALEAPTDAGAALNPQPDPARRR
jgi:hypothetical protein